MIGLSEKVAFITGAAHGQGRTVALALAKAGANIVAFDVADSFRSPGYVFGSEDELDSLQREVEALGVWCLTVTGDVRKDADISRAVHSALVNFGRIDILFNNADVGADGLAHELPEADWDTMIDINLKGAWLVARRIIPVMIRQHSGVIINNASIAGLRGMNRLSHYAASKWGLVGLTKSWAIELASHAIRVNSIHPTRVNTPLTNELVELEDTTAQNMGEHSVGNLLPVSWVDSEDVAAMVLYLVSDEARYITGSQFVLDAGLVTR